MATGLRVINDNSELLIDSEYVNPTFVQKVEFNTTAIREQAGGFYLHRYYTLREYTTPNISVAGKYIVLWTIPENISNGTHKDVWYSFPTSVSSGGIYFSCYVFSNSLGTPLTYNLPTAYIFAVDSTAVSALYSNGPALRMYNSAGGKTFDSNLTQLVPYTFSDDVNLPTTTTGDSTITLSSLPTNPIFLLPNSDLLTLVNTRVYFSNYPGHIETVTTTSFRRVGSTIYCRANGIYSSQEDTILYPQDAYILKNGASNSLSLMVADADFYQAPASSGVGGNNPTYTLSSNYNTVNEGTTFVVTLTTTLTSNGTIFPYTVTGISAADLSSGGLNGNFIVQNNSATASFTVSNDMSLEGTETFTLTLEGINSSVSVSILDTSKPNAIYSFGAVTPVNEGSTTGYVDFNHQYAAGKFISFAIVAPTAGVAATSADVTLNYLSAPGLVISASNDQAGSFAVGYNVTADSTTEGPEYFRVSATVDNTTYYSNNILINDTSLTAISYSISAATSWPESSTGNIANITATGINGTTLYFTTDNGVVVPQTTSATSNSNSYSINVSYNVGIVPYTTSFTLQVRTGSQSGTVVATTVVFITNNEPSYSFGATSSVNEGSSGSVQFNYNYSANTNFAFAVVNPTSGSSGAGDVTLNTTSFTVGNTDAAGTVSVSYSVPADVTTEGPEYFRIQAYINGSYYTSDNITINDTSRTRSYSISTASTWTESTSNAITIYAYNATGIALYLTSSDSGIASVLYGFPTSWTVDNDNYATSTYFSAANVLTTTNVTLYLRVGSASGTVVAQTTVTIADANPQFSWATTPLSVNEGSSNSLNFNYTEAANTTISWYINGPTGGLADGSGDVSLLTGDYTVGGSDSAGSVSVSYSATADALTEGPEYFRLVAYANGGYYYSNNITINDTSRTPVSQIVVNNPPWKENRTQSTQITLTNLVGYTYYPTSSNSAVTCQTFNFYVDSNDYTTTLYWNVGDVGADTTVTLYLRRSRANGAIDAQASVTVLNILPAGTAIGSAYCLNYNVSPYTLRQVRADGDGGSYNDDTNNSTTCGYVPPTPRGTYLTQYCSGYSLYYRYADGNYGYYDTLQSNRSPTCGWNPPAYGTYLSQYCSGYSLYYRYANGEYGYFDVLQGNNSYTCGYVDPPVYAITSPLNIDESTTQGRATLLHYYIVGSKTVYISAVGPSNGGSNGAGDVVVVTSSLTVTGNGTPTIYYYANPDSVTEGTEYFRLQAVVDGNVVSTSDNISISDTSVYPAYGTPIGGAYCLAYGSSPYTLRQVRANGSGGTYNDDTNNSGTCGYVPPTPRGTYLTQYCSGYALYYRYADGNYGYYDTLQSSNSATCGWNPPARGTYLSQYCSGYALYYRLADGSYGYYDELQNSYSSSCGWNPPAYGTYLSQYCSGYTLYYRYANGSYGYYDSVAAYNSPTCGYSPPVYSLQGTFSALDNNSSQSFYLYVTNPEYDNVYVRISGGAGRVSVSPLQFTTNSGQNYYYMTVSTTQPTSTVSAEYVTITVAHNNGSVEKSFTFYLPGYTAPEVSSAPLVTSVVPDGEYKFAGEGINLIIYFSGAITADTYVNIRIDAGPFGTLYYPYNGGAGGHYTSGQYGDYVVLNVGQSFGYYAGPVNPGGAYVTGVTSYAKAVTAGGGDRQGYVQSPYLITLDPGSNDR
jgi:hypothetical protein